VTQTYLSSQAITAPFIPREASAAGWLRSNAVTGKWHLVYWTVKIVRPRVPTQQLEGLVEESHLQVEGIEDERVYDRQR
jgi:hypothetical protein